MIEQFKKDVLKGLSNASQKTLPSKYFYDKKGDEIFVKIMAMPEYYLTKAEMDIFTNKSAELIASFDLSRNSHFEVVDFGAGDGTKTVALLKALMLEGYSFDYLPVDISQHALDGLKKMMKEKLPDLSVKPRHGDYFITMEQLKRSTAPKIILCLGSNIGNLSDEQAATFIDQLDSNLKTGDKIVLGVDLRKSKEIVLPAYNDAQGITREFNLNLLDRINRELDADFDRSQFEHLAYYEEQEGIAKSYLRSKRKQSVTINALYKTFHFEKDETIHTEISRKYDDTILSDILKGTGMTIEAKIMDSNALFADYVLKRN